MSKKLENLQAAIALHFAHHNLVQCLQNYARSPRHGGERCKPAKVG
ncbi:MAG: hypothetical protein ACXW3X_14170 [Rhodoplanes sp.]